MSSSLRTFVYERESRIINFTCLIGNVSLDLTCIVKNTYILKYIYTLIDQNFPKNRDEFIYKKRIKKKFYHDLIYNFSEKK